VVAQVVEDEELGHALVGYVAVLEDALEKVLKQKEFSHIVHLQVDTSAELPEVSSIDRATNRARNALRLFRD
jgi:hypothetical protein